MPEPETPVTVVKTPRGNCASRLSRLLRVMPVSLSQALGSRRGGRGDGSCGEEVAPRLRELDAAQACGRTGVENLSALLTGAGTDVDDPVGAADDIELVLDDEEGVTGALEIIERVEQRLGVGGMQAGGRLVEHVDDAEEIGVQLGGKAQTLELAGGERRCAAFEREIAEAEIEEHGETRGEVSGDALA